MLGAVIVLLQQELPSSDALYDTRKGRRHGLAALSSKNCYIIFAQIILIATVGK
ncbi:hypothetical protein [Nostoc sp. PA-18-2419]|uniref:hypothetical protein n=1 Tax=Nostoc sp. PA-18-2419 TaxID=2575443 RepID=UPI00167AEB2E|nr:hypothetical protein [Nostoc sp. PA-18-2419]